MLVGRFEKNNVVFHCFFFLVWSKGSEVPSRFQKALKFQVRVHYIAGVIRWVVAWSKFGRFGQKKEETKKQHCPFRLAPAFSCAPGAGPVR